VLAGADQRAFIDIDSLLRPVYGYAKQGASFGQQNRFGRLDPPVLFALDEAPNVVPLPLHRLTSEARGLGITFFVCVRSRQQLD
jgi:hypothetical protein